MVKPLNEMEDIIPGTYFLYPTATGQTIKCAMLYEADGENNIEIMSCESLGILSFGEQEWGEHGASELYNRLSAILNSYDSVLNEYCAKFVNMNLSTKVRVLGSEKSGAVVRKYNGTFPEVTDLTIWTTNGIVVSPMEGGRRFALRS